MPRMPELNTMTNGRPVRAWVARSRGRRIPVRLLIPQGGIMVTSDTPGGAASADEIEQVFWRARQVLGAR
jgi:hypothetical protein